MGAWQSFQLGDWIEQSFEDFFEGIELPEDEDLVLIRTENDPQYIIPAVSQTIGIFGDKRCKEKFDYFLIGTPKTHVYDSLEHLVDDSRIYDSCFRALDNKLYTASINDHCSDPVESWNPLYEETL